MSEQMNVRVSRATRSRVDAMLVDFGSIREIVALAIDAMYSEWLHYGAERSESAADATADPGTYGDTSRDF